MSVRLRRNLQSLLACLLLGGLAVPGTASSAHRPHNRPGHRPHHRPAHHPRRHHRRHRHHRGAAAASCAGADTPAGAAPRAQMRAAVLCLVNIQRTGRGLPPLNDNPKLDRSAQLWSNVMVSTGVFGHGSDFASRLTAAGYRWGYAGENIATGFQTPREVVSAWMRSRDHCRNILDPHFLDAGTGVDSQPFGGYGSGTWTQDFGLPLGHRPPSGRTGPQSGCPY